MKRGQESRRTQQNPAGKTMSEPLAADQPTASSRRRKALAVLRIIAAIIIVGVGPVTEER